MTSCVRRGLTSMTCSRAPISASPTTYSATSLPTQRWRRNTKPKRLPQEVLARVNQARATAVTTRTLYKAPAPAGWGFDFSPAILTLKRLLHEFWGGRPPMQMYPDDVVNTLEYHERLGHLRRPHPCEGSVSEARSCFFLRKYTGQREAYWVNT